mmetsp:Transcript_24459/g.39736  ORF Transcript_24459/g.39736 Transcript_24459/m.39736 type:complete len:149 (-) Transcript_24459:9-455(-)
MAKERSPSAEQSAILDGPSSVTAKLAAETLLNVSKKPASPAVSPTSKKQAIVDTINNGNSGRWTKAEDESLRHAVESIGARNWKRVASEFLADTRTDVQCLHRWQKVLRPGLVKGPWTAEEDETIKSCMSRGITRWSEIAKLVPGRIG